MSRREKLLLTGILAVLAGIGLLARPGCPWRNLLGIPCPGCGMTRAWLRVLALDFAGAFAAHPMFWSGPLFFWMFWRDWRVFPGRGANAALLLGLTGGLLGCWIYRLHTGLIP